MTQPPLPSSPPSTEKEAQSNTITILPIDAEATIPLRHSILWPNHPLSYVHLPSDATGYHFGAFVPGSDVAVAIISLFMEDLPDLDNDTIAHTDMHASSSSSSLSIKEDVNPTTTIVPVRPVKAARFRKFACLPSYRRRGIGTLLLRRVFELAREMGVDVVWCDARVSAGEWYLKRGMVGFGDGFWKGAVEYLRMKIVL